MGDNMGWLVTVPPGDNNFKSTLKRATDEEIRGAINSLDGKDGVKTKVKAMEAELKRRNKREK